MELIRIPLSRLPNPCLRSRLVRPAATLSARRGGVEATGEVKGEMERDRDG